MTEETRDFLAKTLVFRHGTEVVIWGIPLDTLEIDEHELDEHLADGWHAHPFHARDAQAALVVRQAEEAAEAQRLKDEQAAAEKKRLQDEVDAEAERVRLKKQADDDAAAENELREKLLAEATALKIKVNKTWGIKTLQEAIAEAKAK